MSPASEVRDLVVLVAMIFVLFSSAVFWKLYFFKPPIRTNAENEFRNTSHAVSNEASQLQSTLKRAREHFDALQILVETMQNKKNNGGST